MVLTVMLNKVLNDKVPDPVLLVELIEQINIHLPEGSKLNSFPLPDPLVVIARVISLSPSAQQVVMEWLEIRLDESKQMTDKKKLNTQAKMIVLGLGVGIAILAVSVDASVLSTEFLTKLIELFLEIASSGAETETP